MRTVLYSNEATGKFDSRKFLKASLEEQRFIVWNQKFGNFLQIIKYETDEKLCYFSESLRSRFGTKGFIQRTATTGFTLNKTTKKLSLWFNKKLSETGVI